MRLFFCVFCFSLFSLQHWRNTPREKIIHEQRNIRPISFEYTTRVRNKHRIIFLSDIFVSEGRRTESQHKKLKVQKLIKSYVFFMLVFGSAREIQNCVKCEYIESWWSTRGKHAINNLKIAISVIVNNWVIFVNNKSFIKN